MRTHLTPTGPAGLVIRKSSQGSHCLDRLADSSCLWSCYENWQEKTVSGWSAMCGSVFASEDSHSLITTQTGTHLYTLSGWKGGGGRQKKCEGTVLPNPLQLIPGRSAHSLPFISQTFPFASYFSPVWPSAKAHKRGVSLNTQRFSRRLHWCMFDNVSVAFVSTDE